MDIKNYTFIAGKKINRLWGWEYRYTVQNSTGRNIDSIVKIADENVSDEDIAKLIVAQLAKIDVVYEPLPDPIELAKQEKEDEIKAFLVSKELITSEDTVWDIKSKDEIIADVEAHI